MSHEFHGIELWFSIVAKENNVVFSTAVKAYCQTDAITKLRTEYYYPLEIISIEEQ